jgi:DNA polymerase III epsilon subunit-like protein
MTEPVTFCIVDIETNGSDPEDSEVIQLSLLLVEVDPETGRAPGPGA